MTDAGITELDVGKWPASPRPARPKLSEGELVAISERGGTAASIALNRSPSSVTQVLRRLGLAKTIRIELALSLPQKN